MIRTEAGVVVISIKLKKLNDFIYFFTYLLLYARGGKYSPVRIHQKVFNDLKYTYKVETFWERN